MPHSLYLIALGSNRRHHRHGAPRAVIAAACRSLQGHGLTIARMSRVIASRPLGPSQRIYANAAAIIEAPQDPPALLALLQQTEAEFGPRRGQAWSSRVLDLDIILWAGGAYASDQPALVIPHPLMRQRTFVLGPAAQIAGEWRDPLTGLSIAQLHRRNQRSGRPAEKSGKAA